MHDLYIAEIFRPGAIFLPVIVWVYICSSSRKSYTGYFISLNDCSVSSATMVSRDLWNRFFILVWFLKNLIWFGRSLVPFGSKRCSSVQIL